MSKHYVRVDDKQRVTYGFSDDFETPIETDICINENGGRQFELLGELNPKLVDDRLCHRYIYEKVETPENIPVQEDASDEVIVDTSKVTLDEGTLTDVQVNATANGYKTVINVTYNIRYATQEELDTEYEEIKPELKPTTDEKISVLQEQVDMLQTQNDMLTECLLEVSEVIYSGELGGDIPIEEETDDSTTPSDSTDNTTDGTEDSEPPIDDNDSIDDNSGVDDTDIDTSLQS